MSFSDPIADMSTRLRNATAVGKTTVRLPHSKVKAAVAGVLNAEGYVGSVTTDKQELVVELTGGERPISGIKRISKPGRRLYADKRSLPKVRNGLGVAIVSTSQGVMSSNDARRRHLGGEILLEVY